MDLSRVKNISVFRRKNKVNTDYRYVIEFFAFGYILSDNCDCLMSFTRYLENLYIYFDCYWILEYLWWQHFKFYPRLWLTVHNEVQQREREIVFNILFSSRGWRTIGIGHIAANHNESIVLCCNDVLMIIRYTDFITISVSWSGVRIIGMPLLASNIIFRGGCFRYREHVRRFDSSFETHEMMKNLGFSVVNLTDSRAIPTPNLHPHYIYPYR